jgi:hypothetical protein
MAGQTNLHENLVEWDGDKIHRFALVQGVTLVKVQLENLTREMCCRRGISASPWAMFPEKASRALMMFVSLGQICLLVEIPEQAGRLKLSFSSSGHGQ